jgi:hypothetical protein
MEILSSSKINYHPRSSKRSYSYERFLRIWFYYTGLFENMYQKYIMYNVSLIKLIPSSELSISKQMFD